MHIVGVTGGIGSGKTTVCKIFELLGIPVFYADAEAKQLYDNKNIKNKVVKIFGKKILNGKENVDKKKLGKIVFSDSSSLHKINTIIHPEVQKKFNNWKKKQNDKKYVIHEAAIMIESGAYKYIDFLISIKCDKSMVINMIIKRDKLKISEIKNRMKMQISDTEREKYADAIIVNDGNHSLIKQTLEIHKRIIKHCD